MAMKRSTQTQFRKKTVRLAGFLVWLQVLHLASMGFLGHMMLPGQLSAQPGTTHHFTPESLEVYLAGAECDGEEKRGDKGDTARGLTPKELEALVAYGDGEECDGSKKRGDKGDTANTSDSSGLTQLLADCEDDDKSGKKGDTAKVHPFEPPCAYCLTPQGAPVQAGVQVAVDISEVGQLFFPLAKVLPQMEVFSTLQSRAPPTLQSA